MPIKPAAECKYAEVDQIKEIHEQVNLTYVGPSVETSGANFGATMMLDPAGTSDACADIKLLVLKLLRLLNCLKILLEWLI